MKGKNIYQKVTDAIIDILEKKQAGQFDNPWISVERGIASNPYSNTIYKGLNQLYLSLNVWENKYPSNKWLTFIQINDLKSSIIKDEKATEIMFTDFVYYNSKNERITRKYAESLPAEQRNKLKRVQFIKYFNVWNVAQVKGLPEAYYLPEGDFTSNVWERNEMAESIIYKTGAKIEHVLQNSAYYNLTTDIITLPNVEQFKGKEEYYETAFHELIHWTGHPARLNRKTITERNKENYMIEELVAELGSAFVCASFGMTRRISSNAAYLESWLKHLNENPRFIFSVSAQAQRGAEFILQTQKEAAKAA